MAGISKKQTKNGVKYVITYRDIFGKQHTYGSYDTKKDARKDLTKFDNKKNLPNTITYGQIFREFLKKAEKKYSKSTIINHNYYYNNHLKRFDNIAYDKINSIMWQNYFDEIKSPYIMNNCLKFAKAAVNYFIKHELLEKNVFNKIEKKTPPKPDINHLTKDELKQVLEECKKSYSEYYTLLFTFIGTGAREGEIFALEKSDFNYEEKTLRISKQYTNHELVNKTKTENSNRVVYLFEELADVIKEHIKTLDKDNPLLFPNKVGGYIDGNNFRTRVWYKILKLCNINKRVRLHDLRGSYIDLALSSGLSIKFTQNNVGHSKSETTLNIYARNNQDMVNHAQEKLNNIFSEKCELNVSQTKKTEKSKIIYFPKRSGMTSF